MMQHKGREITVLLDISYHHAALLMTPYMAMGPDQTTPSSPGFSRYRWPLAAIVSALLICWQSMFFAVRNQLHKNYAITASVGMALEIHFFYYFFHHFGLFPVGARQAPLLDASARAAADFVSQHGQELKMDFGLQFNTPRFGEYGKLFLFYPDVLFGGNPAQPSIVPFNTLLFIVSLLAVLWAFWNEGYALLGIILVVLMGSNPFQLYATYRSENVFGIPIAVSLIALAAHLRFLTGRKGIDQTAWIIAISGGMFFACVREVRSEATLIGLAVVLTYLTIRSAPFKKRVTLLLTFAIVYAITGWFWKLYWNHKFVQARQFVAAHGGQTYDGPRDRHHNLWHAVFCGLGDYGQDRNFVWDDRAAFKWAANNLPKDALDRFHYVSGYYLEETCDGINHVAPTDLPVYNRALRGHVLREIRDHPRWYLHILFRRFVANLNHATPVSLAFREHHLGMPGFGWIMIPALAGACYLRKYFLVKIILFTLPLNLTALLIYSGRGTTYYGIAHLVATSACIHLLFQYKTWIRAATEMKPCLTS
jgi:hypothetical protein